MVERELDPVRDGPHELGQTVDQELGLTTLGRDVDEDRPHDLDHEGAEVLDEARLDGATLFGVVEHGPLDDFEIHIEGIAGLIFGVARLPIDVNHAVPFGHKHPNMTNRAG